MKKHTGFILLNAAFGLLSANASVDCIALSLSVKNAVAVSQSKVLEIVSSEVSASPACACEIVKAAIEGSNANSKTVAAIVEAAAIAAPDQMRLVSQCAVAVAPDALGDVQAVVTKLDPNLGETGHSSKDSKDAKAPAGEVAAMPNPLDFPGQGPIGPTPGGPGGFALIPFTPPLNVAPPVLPPALRPRPPVNPPQPPRPPEPPLPPGPPDPVTDTDPPSDLPNTNDT